MSVLNISAFESKFRLWQQDWTLEISRALQLRHSQDSSTSTSMWSMYSNRLAGRFRSFILARLTANF